MIPRRSRKACSRSTAPGGMYVSTAPVIRLPARPRARTERPTRGPSWSAWAPIWHRRRPARRQLMNWPTSTWATSTTSPSTIGLGGRLAVLPTAIPALRLPVKGEPGCCFAASVCERSSGALDGERGRLQAPPDDCAGGALFTETNRGPPQTKPALARPSPSKPLTHPREREENLSVARWLLLRRRLSAEDCKE